jgi:hypothetical protein
MFAIIFKCTDTKEVEQISRYRTTVENTTVA